MDHRDSMDEQSEDDGDGESSGAAATGPVSAAHGAGIQPVGGHGRTSCSFCALGPEASEGGTREGTKITAEEAATIFCARCPYAKTAKHPTLSHDLSLTFGISQRAVRDIWNLRTWGEVTRPYWNAEDYQRFHEKYAATKMCASCREAVNQARLAIAWPGSQAGPSQSQTAAGGYPGGSHLHLQSTAGAGPFAARPLPDSATAQHVAFASMPSSFPPAWPSLQCAMPQASVNQSASWSGSGLPVTQPVEPAAVADLAGNNAGGTFINGWVMPEWLTPPDVELPDSFSDEEGATGSTNV